MALFWYIPRASEHLKAGQKQAGGELRAGAISLIVIIEYMMLSIAT